MEIKTRPGQMAIGRGFGFDRRITPDCRGVTFIFSKTSPEETGQTAPLLSGLDSRQRVLSACGFTTSNGLLLGKSKRNAIMPGSLEFLPMSSGPIQNINAIQVRPQVKSKEELYVYRLLH